MSFIDSYKRLEKLCGEIYNDNHGLSAYIDEMINNPIASHCVPGWDGDLKKLKHFRWVRNQIAHEPGCTEDNMCEPSDVRWLDDFYSRIMSASDPLALYHRARSPRTAQKPRETDTSEPTSYTYPQYKKTSSKPAGCLTYLMCIPLVAVVVVLIASII